MTAPNKRPPESLEKLPNLGLKSKDMLLAAGITSIEQLQTLGAIPAYVKIKRSGSKVSLNLLWALEAALTGQHWQEVAREHHTTLLLALAEYEKQA